MPRARKTTRPRWTTRSSQLSHGNGIEGRTTIYPAIGSEYQSVSLIQEFKVLIPPIFRDGPNFSWSWELVERNKIKNGYNGNPWGNESFFSFFHVEGWSR